MAVQTTQLLPLPAVDEESCQVEMRCPAWLKPPLLQLDEVDRALTLAEGFRLHYCCYPGGERGRYHCLNQAAGAVEARGLYYVQQLTSIFHKGRCQG